MATQPTTNTGIRAFLTRRQGGRKFTWADILTYAYLLFGLFMMFGPVIWIVLSSFKSVSDLDRFPPRILPYRQESVEVAGYDEPLLLYDYALEDGSTARYAWVRRVGLEASVVDPDNPEEIIKIPNFRELEPVEGVYFAFENYEEGIQSFNFARYFFNSVVVTVVATMLTLFINSLAAFSLSKYEYPGRNTVFIVIISTLMVPISVILVPAFLVITQIGWNNNLLGVIVPGAATPTGVFLLRQYMLTIPDDLLDAARIDGSSEWGIYTRVILPLSGPALAVLAIFSVMWRWNDFLWPKIVLTQNENFTLQLGLQSFQGELGVEWNLVLAMTVLSILPITLVFAFLQRFITTGIATTGLK